MKKKADEDEKPITEEVKKTDEAEMPKAEQQAPATTATEEVNKHVETPASDVTREEVVVLNKESAPEPEADSVSEEAVDVVKEELQANEPHKVVAKEEEVSEAEQNKETIVANVEDKLAEQPEVSEKIEQEPAETKPENTEAATEVPLKKEVEENDTKDAKTSIILDVDIKLQASRTKFIFQTNTWGSIK
ncbi:hypothetical protein A4A49_22255 [Nicotiana attenuata]|uniref:Uncharacterized protein n=1 Tax=Nicotiana attenuata TaxID=49451 RepID=A0A314KND3_NICAT|nr:hypothetical protein A4A49_22255 [Nicotiana attenuata]